MRTTSITLLDFLAPRVFHNVRHYSKPPLLKHSKLQPNSHPQLHAQIRDKILAQAPIQRAIPEAARSNLNHAVQSIKASLRERDLPSALRTWTAFAEQLDAFAALGPRDVHPVEKDIGKFIKKTFKLRHLPENWDDRVKAAADSFALTAAKNGDAVPLYIYMLHHIRARDADKVISLYQQFFESVGNTLRDPAHSSTDLLEDTDVLPQVNPDHISILGTAIAAHAMKDSFKDAFDTYAAAGVRINQYQRAKILGQMPFRDEELTTRLRRFLSRLAICYIALRSPSFVKHITNLSHPSTFTSLDSLYLSVLKGVQGFRPYIALLPHQISEQRPVALTESAWSAFQTGFLKCNQEAKAIQVWADMKSLQITPGVTMWTGLLDYYADLRNSNKAMQTWNDMLAAGVEPSALSHRAMLSALFHDGHVEEGLIRFEEYKTLFKIDIPEAIFVYNTVLEGLLRRGRTTDAQRIFTSMKEEGPTPDVVTYNTFLAHHGRFDDFKSIAAIMREMEEKKILGDVVTFSTLLSALLHAGRKDATGTVLHLMRKQGVQPNVATYTAIINDLLRDEDDQSLQAALELLEWMEQDPDIKPNEVTYTAILAGIYRGSWLQRDKADTIKADLLRRMKRMTVPMTLRTYHILIRASMESEDPEAYKDALAYLLEMESQNIPRVQTTWYLVLTGLVHRQKWELANEMVKKMYSTGHDPSSTVLRRVEEIQRRYY